MSLAAPRLIAGYLALVIAAIGPGLVGARLSLGLALAQAEPSATQDDPPRSAAEEALADEAAASASAAEADDEPRPWAVGVSPVSQKRALELYKAGNTQLNATRFVQAVANYREAIEHWDHPGIHYNLTLALIHLEQPLDAYKSVQKALRYGAQALERDEYQQALNYRSLLEQQVVHMEVTCEEPGAKVFIDGKEIFVAPGKSQQILLPGEHQIVASKPGFVTVTKALLLLPGKRQSVAIQLFRADDMVTVTERRWSPWSPWVAVGAGLAMGVGSGVLHVLSRRNFADYDEQFAVACPGGCPGGRGPEPVEALRERAVQQRGIAITGYVAGTAVLVTGMVMVYLNRPYQVRKERSSVRSSSAKRSLGGPAAEPRGPKATIIPLLSRDTAGIGALFEF